jgi:hypothetical protein
MRREVRVGREAENYLTLDIIGHLSFVISLREVGSHDNLSPNESDA